MLLCIGIFIVLQNGLYLDQITLYNLHAEGISIKWNEKIDLSVKKLRILPQTQEENSFSLEKTNHYIKLVQKVTYLFNSVDIVSIQKQDINASFKYTTQDNGYIKLQTPSLKLDANLVLHKNLFHCHLNSFQEKKNNITVMGDIFIDTNATQLYTQLNCNIHNDANITLFAISDEKQLHYKLTSHKKITNLKPLVEMAHLPKEIFYWAYTAIKMKNVTIDKAYGFIDYDHIKDAYKNIYIHATINKLHYRYNPKLDAIHTRTTELEFAHGIFKIYPKHAYSYGMDLDKSWLYIDFTQPQEMLTLHLLMKKAQLNKDMLHILKTYNIKLPFLQHTGSVQTNLTLRVNLRTIAIQADGTFFVRKGNFDYLGLNIDIFNTKIKLKNYDVTINTMQASIKDFAKANVRVRYNAKYSKGNIRLIFKSLQKEQLKLQTKKLTINYSIHPKGDAITLQKSQWRYKDYNISLEHMKIPFDMKTFTAHIPTSSFTIQNTANGYISGSVNIQKNLADFTIDLLKLHRYGVTLAQSNTQFSLHYDTKTTIKSLQKIYFQVNGSTYMVDNLHLTLDKKIVQIAPTKLSISDYIKTQLSGRYFLDSKKAHITLNRFQLINPINKHILYANNKISLEAQVYNQKVTIKSNDLDSYFVSDHTGWYLDIHNLDKIAQKSAFLQHYKLTQGSIKFYKYTLNDFTQFQADIKYPYTLLRENNKGVKDYIIKGKLKEKGEILFNVNNTIKVDYNDDLTITIDKKILDFHQLILALKTIQNDSQPQKKSPNIFLKATNTQLYLGNKRYILSDSIDLQYYNHILTAQLLYANGVAGLKYQKNHFHLYGHNFNDAFMDKLLVLSKFYGGNLEFSLNGTLDDYKAVFFINNTTIKEYKLLNNILAFINTVPSLMTFSIPGYDKHGLAVKQAYMQFSAKNGLFDISDIYLDSKELKILGKGKASIKQDMIDIVLNLKTDLGSNLSKIPLVGYILLDGDTISTTLKITGKLTNPKVESLLAQDIAVAPLNIIKRTLTLPFHLFDNTKETLHKLQ